MTEQRTVKIKDLLTDEEIDHLVSLQVGKDATSVEVIQSFKDYLNEPERKQRLESKGVLPDYFAYLVSAHMGGLV